MEHNVWAIGVRVRDLFRAFFEKHPFSYLWLARSEGMDPH